MPHIFTNRMAEETKSSEHGKDIVKDEGREARNVMSWRVPNEPSEPATRPSSAAEGSTVSGRGASPSTAAASVASHSSSAKGRGVGKRAGKEGSAGRSTGDGGSGWTAGKEGEEEGSRIRRFFSLLFRNLNRSVDELYWCCEAESSHGQSLEAAALLESCARDFHKVGRPTDRLTD